MTERRWQDTGLPEKFFSWDPHWFQGEAMAWHVYRSYTDPNLGLESVRLILRKRDIRQAELTKPLCWILWLMLKNPAYPLLCLEDPSLPHDMYTVALDWIARILCDHFLVYGRPKGNLADIQTMEMFLMALFGHYGHLPEVTTLMGEYSQRSPRKVLVVYQTCPTPPIALWWKLLDIPDLLALFERVHE